MKLLERTARRGIWLAGFYTLAGNLAGLGLPLYAMQVMDRVLSGQSIDTLIVLSLGVLVALLLSSVLMIIRSQVLQRVSLLVEDRLLPLVMARQARSIALFGQQGVDYIAYLRLLTNYISGNGFSALFEILLVPLYVLLLILIDLRLAALMLLVLALMSLLVCWYRHLLIRSESLDPNLSVTDALPDSHSRMALVLEVLGVSSLTAHNVARGGVDQRKLRLSEQDTMARLEGAARFVSLGFNASLLGVGAYLVIQQELSAGVLIAALILGMRTLGPVEGFMRNQRARELYKRSVAVLEGLLNDERLVAPNQAIIAKPGGDLRATNLVYAYPGARSAVVRGVSFVIREGASIGISGNSGSGKSTLVRLLLGLYQPQAGKVMLGNLDLYQVNRNLLGTHLGYVDQNADLIPMSIADNISRFQPAPIDEVIVAARKAGAHEMIERLPEGYQTLVEANGSNLSGGQRQLVCLARAVFGNPSLIVLDEPSSMLDHQEREKILVLLECLRNERTTVVVVSHDDRILRHLGSVLRIRDGQVETVHKNPVREMV